MGGRTPQFRQIQAHLWVVSHNMGLRLKLLIALAVVGLIALVLAKPEYRRALESKLLDRDEVADGGLGADPDTPPTDFSREQVLLPGAHLSFELMTAPQSHYMGAVDEDAGDEEFRALVQSLGKGGHYDLYLGRAAREIAYQGAVLGDSPPEAALSFVLRAAGSPELSVAQVLVRATGDNPNVIRDAISRALGNVPNGSGQLLVGVGEASTEGEEYDRRVVVMVARRAFDLEATPRSVELDAVWTIQGRAPTSFRDAHASVLYPDLRVVDIPLEVQDGRFRLPVPTGSIPGTLRVSIDGVGDEGPFKLLQLEAEIASPPPRLFEMLVPESETFADLAAAEAHALMLLNGDRRELGLPPLVLDALLSDVARGHSEEMRDNDFFAHLSATTGLAGDRLERAGYRASAHGENLALNDSVYEAQASLLESVGHRRNIINTSLTHVGIGLAKSKGSSGHTSWHLTQLFARKVLPFDTEAATREFLGRINSTRREAGDPPLVEDRRLATLAEEGSQRALQAPTEELPSWLAPRASKIAKSSVAVSVHVFYDFETLEADATSLAPDANEVGIAFVRDQEDLHGRTFLVLITAE